MELLMEENPMYGFPNPRRRRRKSHRNPLPNPVKALSLERWTGGVDFKEAGAAVAGLAAASILPAKVYPMIRKTGTPTTMVDKLIFVALGFGTALGAGMLAKRLGERAGRAALLGGLAGVGVSAINQIAGIKLGSGNIAFPRMLGAGQPVPTSPMRSREETQIIVP